MRDTHIIDGYWITIDTGALKHPRSQSASMHGRLSALIDTVAVYSTAQNNCCVLTIFSQSWLLGCCVSDEEGPWMWKTIRAAMSMGIPMAMGMETAIIPHVLTGILRGFLNRCGIQWKRFKHGINVTADV